MNCFVDGITVPKGCRHQDVAYELAFTNINVNDLSLNKDTEAYYLPAIITRWLFVAFISISLHHYPQSAYLILILVDIFMVIFLCRNTETLLPPINYVVIVQEIFFLLWHVLQFTLFIDSELEIGYSQWIVDALVNGVFAIFLLALSCEYFLLVLSLVIKPNFGVQYMQEEADQELFNDGLSDVSGNKLDKKIETYNRMRMQVRNRSLEMSRTADKLAEVEDGLEKLDDLEESEEAGEAAKSGNRSARKMGEVTETADKLDAGSIKDVAEVPSLDIVIEDGEGDGDKESSLQK